jgi:HAMP domain-containing protein
MKLAWKLLVGLGALLVFISLGMDTTVSTGMGRVHNIGLQGQQQTSLILGCFLFLAGIILFAVLRMKETSDQEAAGKAAREAVQAKAKDEVQLLGAAFSRAGRELKAGWVVAWNKVRRVHIMVLAIIVIGLSISFPVHLVIDYPQGVATEFPTRMLIGAKEPLLVGRLIVEVLLELGLFWLFWSKARK